MKIQQSFYRLMALVITLFMLAACSDSGSNSQAATATTSITEIPSAVLTLPSGGTLRAFIAIDGGTPIELSINSNTATGSIPDLSRTVHSVTVSFEFTDSGGTTYTVATATTTVDLSSGDASVSFAEADYDMASYDDDGDGISNAQELADGSNPGDSACVLGFSLIGKCTL